VPSATDACSAGQAQDPDRQRERHGIRRCVIELTISARTGQLDPELEVVERKGRGHPDTLADGLAEQLSARYCVYTTDRFGAILNHNFDKIGLLGGRSTVEFGSGRMLRPVRVLLNGRAADRFGDQPIPLVSLLTTWTIDFITEELPLLDPENDLEFHFNVSTANTAGYPADDFTPTESTDRRQLNELRSSDTAVICAQYPPTALESAVLAIERSLTSNDRRCLWPWLGNDIKVLAWRTGRQVSMTACIPQIAGQVPDLGAYRRNLDQVRALIHNQAAEYLFGYEVELDLNTKDDEVGNSLYLTAIGSCLESGDEGLAGRGNRPNGVISPLRAHSGEAACGKNPAFFPGKVYNAAAAEIARMLYEDIGAPVEVWLAAQEGRPLDNPWQVVVIHDGPAPSSAFVDRTVKQVLGRIPELTESMTLGRVRLC
jgi:S-adenosylmethionine synthetase